MKLFLLLPLAFAATATRAQFYEPKTSAEDPVQRLFPVEAARVLAWQRGLAGEVTWNLEQSGPGGSTWKIGWKDAAGKVVRERTVTVGAATFVEGAAYYRSVFKQLAGDDWSVPSASPDNASSAFWQGADLAVSSRVDALGAIAKLLADKPKVERAADAARLAGALVHAAAPSIAHKAPLDTTLLARGAAWLAIAEARLREPIDAAWAPILFLAGHEPEASDLWQAQKTKMRSGAERFWSLALAEPRVEAVFGFAARSENRAWALPALYLFVRRDGRLSAPAAELAPGTSDYPLGALPPDRSAEASALAASFPSVRGLAPVAVATREEIAAGLPSTPVEATPAEPTRKLAELTDEAIAQLAKNARAEADQPKPAASVTSVPPPDFKDVEKAWAYLGALKEPPRGADSPEDRMRRIRLWLAERKAAAERFGAAFPNDPRRWDAAIAAYDAAQDLVRAGERDAKRPATEILDKVLAASDASAEAKGEAAFFLAMRAGEGVSLALPHTLPPFHRALSEFIKNYPEHPRAAEAAAIQLQLLEAAETPGADKILADLAAHLNQRVAAQAKGLLEQRARFAELKKKPLELKFTAADGREVDVAKLRGKVLLLDFWASWCGPCMAEAPHVVATYGKLHERGFEILGINLDQDKAAMESALQKAGMTWPQHFDGHGWQNEIAQRFGIRSIPATWLFDKQGKLREIGLRGEELEARIENLLRE
jgi:thiol-disulfide isomerase/thioredoxin